MKLTSRPLSQWPLKYRGLCPTPTFQSFKHWSHILYWGSSSQNNNIIIIYNQCKNLKVVSNVSFVKVVYTRYLYTCIDKIFLHVDMYHQYLWVDSVLQAQLTQLILVSINPNLQPQIGPHSQNSIFASPSLHFEKHSV